MRHRLLSCLQYWHRNAFRTVLRGFTQRLILSSAAKVFESVTVPPIILPKTFSMVGLLARCVETNRGGWERTIVVWWLESAKSCQRLSARPILIVALPGYRCSARRLKNFWECNRLDLIQQKPKNRDFNRAVLKSDQRWPKVDNRSEPKVQDNPGRQLGGENTVYLIALWRKSGTTIHVLLTRPR